MDLTQWLPSRWMHIHGSERLQEILIIKLCYYGIGCCTVWCKVTMLQRNFLLPSSGYNEDGRKTLAPNTLQCHIPYTHDCNIQYSDNVSVCRWAMKTRASYHIRPGKSLIKLYHTQLLSFWLPYPFICIKQCENWHVHSTHMDDGTAT